MNYITTHQKPPLSFPSVSGAICTFNSQYAGLPLKSHSVAVVGTQSGSGTPSPSNPRALNGWDSLYIRNTQKNAFDASLVQNIATEGNYTGGGYRSKPIWLTPNTKYTVSFNSGVSSSSPILLINNTQAVNSSGYLDLRNSSGSKTFTTDANGCLYIGAYASDDNTINARINASNIQVELGETATTYEAYNGTTATIPFGSTIYGGNYDAVSGVLTVTHGFATFDGSADENWTNVLGAFNIIIDEAKQIQTPMCNLFNAVASRALGFLNDLECAFANVGAKNLNFKYSSVADLTAWKSFLSANNVQVCYELATPQTIQLSPVRVETQLVNNIFADTGDTTLQYIKLG